MKRVNLNPAVGSGFHKIIRRTELFCRIPREAGVGPSAMRARSYEVYASRRAPAMRAGSCNCNFQVKIFLAVLCFAACAASNARVSAETVSFKTADGCVIEASYQSASSGAYVFVNTHGLGSNRNEWGVLEARLKKTGHGYLSIDLRGHGGSLRCSGKPVDYKTFSPARWAGLSTDIKAAADFLKDRKVPQNRLVLCGASIGANLSLKAAAESLKPAGIVLLSPGLSYAGIEAAGFLKNLGAAPLLLAASGEDAYAWESAGSLTVRAKSRNIPAVFRAGPGGHGAKMLSESSPELLDYIFSWVKKLK